MRMPAGLVRCELASGSSCHGGNSAGLRDKTPRVGAQVASLEELPHPRNAHMYGQQASFSSFL